MDRGNLGLLFSRFYSFVLLYFFLSHFVIDVFLYDTCVMDARVFSIFDRHPSPQGEYFSFVLYSLVY